MGIIAVYFAISAVRMFYVVRCKAKDVNLIHKNPPPKARAMIPGLMATVL